MSSINDNNILIRGFGGRFSRIITRGFGRCFRTFSFKPKKKEPILREFTFEIYSPIIKKINLEKEIKVSLIKKFILNYILKTKIRKQLKKSYQIKTNIAKKINKEFLFTFKIDNKKLINTLNLLLEDD